MSTAELSAWARTHVGDPWNATCAAASAWLEGRAQAAEAATVATPMTPFRGDYRCVAPLIGTFTRMSLPGDARLASLIMTPEPAVEGRRRLHRAYIEGNRDGHFVTLDPLPCDGPLAEEAGGALASGDLDALPGIVNRHLATLGHAPASWVKIADLRFFAPFRRAMDEWKATGDLTAFGRNTILAIDCVYREKWIAFSPEPPCFSRLREIAGMLQPMAGKAWGAGEFLDSGRPQGSPLRLDRPKTAANPDFPRWSLAFIAKDGGLSVTRFDPTDPLCLTPPFEALGPCRGASFNQLARQVASVTGSEYAMVIRQEVLLHVVEPLLGHAGSGDLRAWSSLLARWGKAKSRYGRDWSAWPGPVPPGFLQRLARVVLDNVR